MAAEETPLFAQYRKLKEEHKNEVLFFRLGDFYEMFGDDAQEVSRLLNLTLTHRGPEKMCGIPYHAAKIYIARLLRAGKKIAVAEQVGEIAKGKGLTDRKVVEIITPGTALESEYLDGGINSFLSCLCIKDGKCGFSYIDVTTGEFKATSFSEKTFAENFPKELGRIKAKELLLSKNLENNPVLLQVLPLFEGLSVSYYPDWDFNPVNCTKRLLKQLGTQSLKAFSMEELSCEATAAGFLLDYIDKTTNTVSPHIKTIKYYSDSDYLIIDDSSRRNLEITENLRDQGKQFTVLECLDFCSTAMGSRMLMERLMFPLTDRKKIESRLDHVDLFYSDRNLFHRVRNALSGILDVERLASRIAMDRAHAKDLMALSASLCLWKEVHSLVEDRLNGMSSLSDADEIISLINRAIMDDPSTSLTEGNIIRDGYNAELDRWRQMHGNFNKVLDDYIEEEKEATGIQNLRIKKSGNMGYFIEVTKGKLDMVPSHFIIRRSLVNAERYTTEKLRALEQNLNESGGRILEMERDLFLEVRDTLKKYVPFLQKLSREIAYTDVSVSFAAAAVKFGWTRPYLRDDSAFIVRKGRHPSVEAHLPSGEFIPNDLELSSDDKKTFALITGPNMAGKSTFLRQNAIIALLCQSGSFVPAESASLSVCDRIFCRVGASDNLARGESTFLVEMTETARILRNATERSLVIMDEVGRGTGTEDGLSIARAVSEYLLNRIKCKTLFATHYHELTRMDSPFMKKLCMDVLEDGKSVVFLRKVKEGSSENSFGLYVARLAGLPSCVVDRASLILQDLKKDGENITSLPEETYENAAEEEQKTPVVKESLTGALFSDEELILDEILSADVNLMTPMEALQKIMRWKSTLNNS